MDMDRNEPASGGRLRIVALGTSLVGAIGSVALTLYAGRDNPHRFLTALFLFLVIAPFAALFWGNLPNRGWSPPVRLALQGITFVVAIGSLALYGARAMGPVGPTGAFVFVAVPPVSGLLIAVTLLAAALLSRRTTSRGPG
jgi:membrane-bound metal-dependent hydrolase YbcI (DUF457 family)